MTQSIRQLRTFLLLLIGSVTPTKWCFSIVKRLWNEVPGVQNQLSLWIQPISDQSAFSITIVQLFATRWHDLYEFTIFPYFWILPEITWNFKPNIQMSVSFLQCQCERQYRSKKVGNVFWFSFFFLKRLKSFLISWKNYLIQTKIVF